MLHRAVYVLSIFQKVKAVFKFTRNMTIQKMCDESLFEVIRTPAILTTLQNEIATIAPAVTANSSVRELCLWFDKYVLRRFIIIINSS